MPNMAWLVGLLALLHVPHLISAACVHPTPSLSLSIGGAASTAWDTTCTTSVTSDFSSRDALAEYTNDNCWGTSTWGPYPNPYSVPTVPTTCSQTTWAQQRVLAVIDKMTKRGLNYCHHHTPTWLPSAAARIAIDPSTIAASGSTGTCSAAGTDASGNITWIGVDCSTFTSFVYNYGLGAYLSTGIDDQACGPNAPGRILPVSKSTTNLGSILQPGDMLYIAATSTATQFSISHVIFWTGIQLTYDNGPYSYNTLLARVPANQQSLVIADVQAARAANQPVYVIADSHNAGPSYRIFAGWWARAFSHARRLINADPSLPTTSTQLQYSTTAGCVNVQPGVSPVPNSPSPSPSPSPPSPSPSPAPAPSAATPAAAFSSLFVVLLSVFCFLL